MGNIAIAVVYLYGCIHMMRVSSEPVWSKKQALVYQVLASLGIVTAILLLLVEFLHMAGLF